MTKVVFCDVIITLQNQIKIQLSGLGATRHAGNRDPLWAGSEIGEPFLPMEAVNRCAVVLHSQQEVGEEFLVGGFPWVSRQSTPSSVLPLSL